jgi:hypothetical protein
VVVCKQVPETKDVVVTRYVCVPTVEERTVTRMVTSSQPVATMVTRCVDKGGHYECKEVPCHHGLFARHSCDGCGECVPTRTVSCYVPNLVTEQVPVTCYKKVCTPVTEKVNVTVNKMVAKQETVKVTTCKIVTETVQQKCVVNVVKQVPYEAVRKVAVCVPVQEKVTCTRLVPVQVEKEVTCVVAPECHGSAKRHCRGGLFHRDRCGACGG